MIDQGDKQARREIAEEDCVTNIVAVSNVPVYEELLDSDPRWALNEGSRHFEEDSAVVKALYKITSRLKSLGISYAVVGGMALFRHGVRRFTEDVDLLVTKSDLKLIHEKLDGLGYVPPFAKSKNLRDVESGVKIEFLLTGGFPGDGKPKPVSFPDPQQVSFEAEGINYIKLPKLIELKLASGMTSPGRLKDLSDVLELIRILSLPSEFANQLDPFVQGKFKELWSEARKRYVITWRNKWLTAKAKSIEEMSKQLHAAAEQLEQMQKDGVFLEDNGGVADDYALLVTTDPAIAEKYGMVDESEYWGVDEEDEPNSDAE